MAINPIDFPCDKTVILSHKTLNHHKHGNSPANCLVTMDYTPVANISNLVHKHGKYKHNLDSKSPYLKSSNHAILGDGVQMLARVTEKRFVHKNRANLISSFPLASNIYNTKSDESNARQISKKGLKSVLTLPNNATVPQLCTARNMNDSEYLSEKGDSHKKSRKLNSQFVRKYLPRSQHLESVSQYCSDIELCVGSSSTDTAKKFDAKKTQKANVESKGKAKEIPKPHHVWAALRNMNRFQFQTTPRLSEDSFIVRRQKKNLKRRNNRKDLRVFETRRTEEIAYISSYKVPKSPTLSPCSSFDKITVIDKNQNIKFGKEIEDKPKKKRAGKLLGPRAIRNFPKNKVLPVKQRNNLKAITYVNETNQKKNDNTPINGLFDVDNTGKMTLCGYPNYYGDLYDILHNNASVDLGYESKTTENDEDFTSFDHTKTNTRASKCSQSKLSDNSGSSKAAAFTKKYIQKKVSVKPKLKTEPDKQINGITKVILSKGQHLEQDDKNESLRTNVNQTRVISSYPTSPPKLTKTEINRQLHRYRFPVVILGKDQLRSSIHVVNSDHPQFDGLDQHIWPFMKNWYEIERSAKVMKTSINSNVSNNKTTINEYEKKPQSKNIVTKPIKILDKIPKLEHKRIPLPLSELIDQTTQNQRKLKPIKQLRDRMIKLLCKNSSAINVTNDPSSTVTDKNENRIISKSINISTDTQDKCDTNTKYFAEKVKKPAIQKRTWARAKWASDFIENVIKKIRSGAYYNQDVINKVCIETPVIERKVTDVETDTDMLQNNSGCISDDFSSINCNIDSKEDDDELLKNIVIPGFDNIQPVLEIKTISINEVAVKHCETNIVVHFDVTVPNNSIIGMDRDSSIIPVNTTNSLTKVFKCQTSIINSILPAELCSIVPNILRDIVNTDQYLELFTAPIDIPCLTTISEVAILPDSLTDIQRPTLAVPTVLPLRSRLQEICNGGYFKTGVNNTPNFHVIRLTSHLVKHESRIYEDIMPHIEINILFDIKNQLKIPIKLSHHDEPSQFSSVLPTTKIEPIEQINTCKTLQLHPVINKLNTCTALQPYSANNYGFVEMLIPFSLMNLLETMATYINNIGLSCFNMIKIDKNIVFTKNMEKSLTSTNLVALRIANSKIDSLNDFSKSFNSTEFSILPDLDETLKSIEKSKLPAICGKVRDNNSTNNNRLRRKGYSKLYRKCKYPSNKHGEKVTPLNRIANLDDFLQALGPGKLLSSVFDVQSENKVMMSITELRKWTNVISPVQALLVVLLSNKKETTNIQRYRPMLLQGIAVKRITKAIELDMEIEVIERENLNRVSRFEGITYLPASVENQDSLYEELCWIAKNTASDYQRPFDHTSEKLLKSLLEKRKQLNPSYLRVMARYVGLGLLKSPGKRL